MAGARLQKSDNSSVAGKLPHLPAANQRVVFALAWPIIISNISVPLLGLVDTAILGHLNDVTPMAAVAIGSQLFTLLLWSFGFLRMGTTAITAQRVGAHGLPGSLPALHLALASWLPVTLICSLLAWTLTPWLLPLFGDDGRVQAMAGDYLQIRYLGIPLTLLQYSLVGWFIGRGETRVPMLMLLVANTLNALCNYVFAWHLGWGAQGIALGSVIAEGVAVLLALYFAHQRGLTRAALHCLTPTWLHRMHREMRQMLHINGDLFIRTLVLLMVFAMFTALGAQQGPAVLASNAVLITLLMLISNALDGFAHAAESLCGRYLGALAYINQANLNHAHSDQTHTNQIRSQHAPQVMAQLHRAMRLTALNSVVVALLMSGLFAVANPALFALLTDHPAVIPLLDQLAPWLIALPLTGVASYWLDGIMIAAQRTRAMRNSMLMAALLIFSPLAALAVVSANNGLLWLAFHAFLLARAAFLLPTLRRVVRQGQ